MREDIAELCETIDNVIDHINEVEKRVKALEDTVREICETIGNAIGYINEVEKRVKALEDTVREMGGKGGK